MPRLVAKQCQYPQQLDRDFFEAEHSVWLVRIARVGAVMAFQRLLHKLDGKAAQLLRNQIPD